jgi:hypothetical protein
LATFLFASCKKDHSKGTEPVGQEYAVNFTVDNILKATTSNSKLRLNTTADTFKKYVKTLNYLVYNSAGKLVRQINQDTTTANFGNIGDKFNAGTYTIVFVANATSKVATSVANSGTTDFTSDYFYGLPFNTPPDNKTIFRPDIFYQKFTITVTNASINQSVILNRIAAQVQIEATDIVPTNIDSVKITFDRDYYYFMMNTLLPSTKFGVSATVLTHVFKPSEKGIANFNISTLFYNTSEAFTVTIVRYPQSRFVSPVIIKNVTCQSNKTTVLTGKVFENIVIPGAFQISFDPVWNTQTINY